MSDWKDIYIFVSSTFQDMHAERDYLVQNVFPELKEWCALRQLHLIDVDLRWGVTEEEAKENESLVRILLNNIDKCLPIFLCLTGQRRGFIPDATDLSQSLKAEYPDIIRHLGKNSVTELEILHACTLPGSDLDIFVYKRDKGYLKHLPNYPGVKKVYTGNTYGTPDSLHIPEQLGTYAYMADWDSSGTVSELALPLDSGMPESASANIWRKSWESAGLSLSAEYVKVPEHLRAHAETINVELSSGRLVGFCVGGESLAVHIIRQLQASIVNRYPDRKEASGDYAGRWLAEKRVTYIPPADTVAMLDAYMNDPQNKAFILEGPAGCGKSTILANWMLKQSSQKIFSHFSEAQTDAYDLAGQIIQTFSPGSISFGEKLSDAVARLPADSLVVIDGYEKIDPELNDLWLQTVLPNRAAVVVSIRAESPRALEWLKYLEKNGLAIVCHAYGFSQKNKEEFINLSLHRHLKKLDAFLVKVLLSQSGSENPLYLSLALAALSFQGRYESIGSLVANSLDGTVNSAIKAMIGGMGNFGAIGNIPTGLLFEHALCICAAIRRPLNIDMLADVVSMFPDMQGYAKENILAALLKLFRNAQPLLEILGKLALPLKASIRTYVIDNYGMEASHAILSGFCLRFEKLFATAPLIALVDCFYHSRLCGRAGQAALALCDYSYIRARVRAGQYGLMLEDYDAAGNGLGLSRSLSEAFQKAVSLFHEDFLGIDNLLSYLADENITSLLDDWRRLHSAAIMRFKRITVTLPGKRDGGYSLEYGENKTLSVFACDASCGLGELYYVKDNGSVQIEKGGASYYFPIADKPVWELLASPGGERFAVAFRDETLAVYDIDRDSQGRPIGLRPAFGTAGLLNGKNGPALCWAGSTLLYQTREVLHVLTDVPVEIPLKLDDILAFGGQGGSSVYAVLCGGRNGVYEICDSGLEEILKTDCPILSFACSGNQMALSLWDNSIRSFEGRSMLWRVDLKKPVREVCFLEGMLLLRGIDNALMVCGNGIPPTPLGSVPPSAGRYPKLSAFKNSVTFYSVQGMCRAELRKENAGAFKLSVISGGEPRALIKEDEGGYIIDPYRLGGISLYDRDCRQYLGNDFGELCSANSWSIVQYCPSPLPSEISANPGLGLHSLFSRAAAIECAAPCLSGGFYLFSSDARVFHSGVFEDNMLSEIARVDEDFMPRKAASSQNMILLVGNSRISGALRFLRLEAHGTDIVRNCAGGLDHTLSAADYHIAGDRAGGFFLSHGNELCFLSHDETKPEHFTSLECGECLDIACCGQYILCLASKGICILNGRAAASILASPDKVSRVAVWGGDMIMEVNNRELYAVSL